MALIWTSSAANISPLWGRPVPGKSTLFNAIGGLDKPDSGTVFINDVDMAQLDARELAYLRCHTLGYIFQSFNLDSR